MLATGTFDLPTCTGTSLGPLCEAASNAAHVTISIYCDSVSTWGHMVVQLVEALLYKLEGSGFDSR